jgi:hypothetical protein
MGEDCVPFQGGAPEHPERYVRRPGGWAQAGRGRDPFWDAHGGPPEGDNLSADQVADPIVWAMSQPSGVASAP